MQDARRWRRLAAVLASLALVATACGGDDETEDTGTADAATEETDATAGDTATDSADDGDSAAAAGDITTDVGVTEEPCPEAVDESKGCIYLGVLSDLTEGPFAALGPSITDAQYAFWNRVNDDGGIGGAFEVDAETYTRDNKYNPEVQNQVYQEIKPNILALAQTLGSPPTAAILDDLKANNIVGAPASWTSLWDYEDVIVESGNNYCTESQNALDYYAEQEGMPETVMSIHMPGDYGEDGAAGAQLWAEANEVDFAVVEQIPLGAGGTTQAAVSAVVQQNPDVVLVSTPSGELGEIVGNAAAQGYQGRFIGNAPTWNPGLLTGPAADALRSQFWQAGPWGPYSADTPGHQAMREWINDLAGEEVQGNWGHVLGWTSSYPLSAALEAAAQNGDLTRQGVFDAVQSLETVDYEGILPEEAGTFTGGPAEQFARSTVMAEPGESDVSMLTPDFYTGPTVEDFTPPDQACYQAVELG